MSVDKMSQLTEIKTVKSYELMPAIAEMLSTWTSVRIMVTGNSMYPFLRHRIDAVDLSLVGLTALKRGDVVLVKRDSGQYVLHRIIKKCEDSIFILGDAQHEMEGPLLLEQVIAVVTSVWRDKLVIDCNDLRWRTCSMLWLLLRPLRPDIIRIYRAWRRWF